MTLKQTLKEKWESNSVIFVAGLMGAAFAAGFGVRIFVPDFAVPRASSGVLTCKYEGLDAVEQAHTARIEPLFSKLREFEKEANYGGHLEYVQDRYMASANRIRGDIDAENANYQSALKTLSRDCK